VAADTECMELPRPLHLLRIAGANLAQSFGLPTGGYVLATWLAGRDAGLWTMLSALWLRSALRRLGIGFRFASATTA
jgi:hypothetical protein